ncbi:carboxypeptidase regulatory-like domain-containing protein [Nocardia miyunensis]|uniref:carboxypeptidase regulatory-like domain-containing protein n=1 Tax=Nocardia miyunensis TaxID=282684 RepID=UPI00082A0A1E|nr:carboxypeptidase regulatory-like domain-containing protein [Nocardia miyunensis]
MLTVFVACLAVGYGMALALGQSAIFGLTYGGMVGLLLGLTVAGPKAGRLAVRCVWGIPAFLIALFCAIEVEQYRVLALIVAALAVVVQLSAPAFFGEFGQDSGVMVFCGYLSGVLVPLQLSKMAYIAPIVAVAAVAAAVVQVVLCRMRPETGLVHVERGFLARTRYVVERSTRLIASEAPTTRAIRKLSDEMTHLNESAMLVDGYLATAASSSRSADRLHRLVFDTELAAQALGRTVIQLSGRPLPAELRAHLLAALTGLDRGGRRHDDALPASTARLLEWLSEHESDSRELEHEQLVSTLYRIVALLGELHRVSDAWTTASDEDLEADVDDEPFSTPVELVAGKLPGTNLLAGRVLDAGGMSGPWNFWSKPNPQLRIAVQMLITLMIAIPLGDALNGHRFYWAVIGAFTVLSNTDSSHDRVRKTIKRVLGTLVGGFLGIGVAEFLGAHHPMATLALLVVSLVLGAYSISAYYEVWSGTLAFALIQLYSFTGGYEDSVVVLRAGENALGAVIATLVALVVLPIATRTLKRHAEANHVHSLATFVRESGEVWSGAAGADGTREQARAVDQAAHELNRFSRSLVRLPGSPGDEAAEEIRSVLRTAAVCAREMSGGSGRAVLTSGQRELLLRITGNLSDSIDGLARIVADRAANSESAATESVELWVRQAADIQRLQEALSVSSANAQLRHVLHYLGYLDDLLGDLAARLEIPVRGSEYRVGAHAVSRELFAVQAQLATAGQPLPVRGAARRARVSTSVRAWPVVDSPSSGDGRWIAGHVHSGTGHPVPGVALTLIDQLGHQVSRATGGSDGSYRIDVPETGSHVLIVSANGYGPVAVTVHPGSGPQHQHVTLLGSGELTGVVRGTGGAPLADAAVTLTDLRGEVVGATITDVDGGYQCFGLVSGDYTLVANAEHMRPVATTLTVPESGQVRYDIDMTPLSALAGWVRTDAGAVPDAQVTVLDATGEPIAHAYADDNGRYTVPDLDAGRYTVVTRGYPPVSSRVRVTGSRVVHDLMLGYDGLTGS